MEDVGVSSSKDNLNAHISNYTIIKNDVPQYLFYSVTPVTRSSRYRGVTVMVSNSKRFAMLPSVDSIGSMSPALSDALTYT